MNRVVAAKEGLSVLIGLDDRIQETLMDITRNPRKPIAGYRFFQCIDCGEEWKEKSRDCLSPSNDTCPSCGSDVFPDNYQQHSEWPVDKSGNLL